MAVTSHLSGVVIDRFGQVVATVEGMHAAPARLDRTPLSLSDQAMAWESSRDQTVPVRSVLDISAPQAPLAAFFSKDGYDNWSCLHMAAVLGDGSMMNVLANLLEMNIVEPDLIGFDGSTLLHTMAWHAREDYARMAMQCLAGSLPAHSAATPGHGDYMPVRQRIALLHRAGADMNASLSQLARAFLQTLAACGLSGQALAMETEARCLDDDPRLQALKNQSMLAEHELKEIIWRTMRIQASPLMCALHDNLRDPSRRVVIEALLEHGANPNLAFYDRELEELLHRQGVAAMATIPLHVAAKDLCAQIVCALLKAGANLDARGTLGENALHFSARNIRNPQVTHVLLQAGAKRFVNATMAGELTALHCAASSNHAGIVTALLDANANVHLRDAGGHSALHYAAAQSSLAVVDALLAHGARILAVSNVQETVLHYAARSANPQIFTGLMNAGAAQLLFAADESGRLPLHAAAAIPGNVETIKTILRAGAHEQIDARTRGQKTALQLAAMLPGNEAAVQCLIDAGAQCLDIDMDSGGFGEPLRLALRDTRQAAAALPLH